MRLHREHVLLVGRGRDGRVEQQRVLEGEDGAPVFHGAEEHAAPRRGDVVQLRQGIGRAEVVVEVVERDLGGVQREGRLRQQAALRDHAQFGRARHGGGALEVAEGKEQQVGGHPRRGPERHPRQAIAGLLGGGHRHAAHRHRGGGHGGGQPEDRLVGRLVPAGHEPSRIGVLELREQRALGASRRVVVDGEQPGGLGADPAGVAHGQAVGARRHRFGERERRRLLRGVHGHLRRRQGRAVRGGQHDRGKIQLERVQGDVAGGLQHVQGDRRRAVEGQRLRVRRDGDVVIAGYDATGQLGGDQFGRGCGQGQARQGAGGRGNQNASKHVVPQFRTVGQRCSVVEERHSRAARWTQSSLPTGMCALPCAVNGIKSRAWPAHCRSPSAYCHEGRRGSPEFRNRQGRPVRRAR